MARSSVFRPYKRCHICYEEMVGIHSHTVREDCEPCGGHSLDANGKDVKTPEKVRRELAKYKQARNIA